MLVEQISESAAGAYCAYLCPFLVTVWVKWPRGSVGEILEDSAQTCCASEWCVVEVESCAKCIFFAYPATGVYIGYSGSLSISLASTLIANVLMIFFVFLSKAFVTRRRVGCAVLRVRPNTTLTCWCSQHLECISCALHVSFTYLFACRYVCYRRRTTTRVWICIYFFVQTIRYSGRGCSRTLHVKSISPSPTLSKRCRWL